MLTHSHISSGYLQIHGAFCRQILAWQCCILHLNFYPLLNQSPRELVLPDRSWRPGFCKSIFTEKREKIEHTVPHFKVEDGDGSSKVNTGELNQKASCLQESKSVYFSTNIELCINYSYPWFVHKKATDCCCLYTGLGFGRKADDWHANWRCGDRRVANPSLIRLGAFRKRHPSFSQG